MKLSLHRSSKTPDWLKIPSARRNRWQKLAVKTNGIVTPANGVTVIGFLGSLGGIACIVAGQYWWAIVLLAFGRLLDIIDGVVAERTGTKSALGEALDASVDKIIILLTVIALFLAGASSWWLLAIFVLPHAIISAIVLYGQVSHRKLHPSRLGKTTTLLAWIAVPLLLLVDALRLTWPDPLVVIVDLFLLVSAGFGFVTAYSYRPRPSKSARL